METGSNISAIEKTTISNFNFVDESFDSSKTAHNYHLSIEVGFSVFAFTILDIQTKKYIAWCSKNHQCSDVKQLTVNLEGYLQEHRFLTNEYRSSSVSYCDFPSTIVPNSYYNIEKEKELYTFNHQVDGGEIFRDHLLNLGAKHLYAIPEKLNRWTNQKWPKATVLHMGSVLIEQLVVFSKSVDKTCVCANIQSKSFDLIIANNGQLKLYNSFEHGAPEDIAYYILYSLEQLEIRNYEIELTLSGQIEIKGKLHELLSDYIKEITFIDGKTGIILSNSFSQPTHKGYSLFNQYLCV
ncbi:MAG: DUF3822 family protein [Flavobacteriales bacterium]|nr:DUF3822 family protein [Flavobacteriales bacterium]